MKTYDRKGREVKVSIPMKDAQLEYSKLYAVIERDIEVLKAALKAHKEKQSVNPKNWGYAGDLQDALYSLTETINRIGG